MIYIWILNLKYTHIYQFQSDVHTIYEVYYTLQESNHKTPGKSDAGYLSRRSRCSGSLQCLVNIYSYSLHYLGHCIMGLFLSDA